ncbi:uncharacterized protein LOC131536088 isoform X3 [Onychostoma macrolepis]|uniref:uncharacterized protein LOC131536088 isoform X3 n=1 Tax=Onychostoma macrolepis TaxID=369639 RepID=UPI00272CA55F|nr:uncharacterized protein LOC131536088 isoform X3 [Onychostoma macrolepis]
MLISLIRRLVIFWKNAQKKRLLKIADRYEIVISDKRLKENIKVILRTNLIEKGILKMEESGSVVSSLQTNLSFEQQKELLLLQMEHERLKHRSEQGKIELEKAKLELEALKLNVMKEGKFSNGTEEQGGVWSLLTVISLILCECFISTTSAEPRAAVGPVLNCEIDNGTYICTGAQYRMYCNTRMHHFNYQRHQNQNQYQCISNDCICVGNKDTCACYYNTSSCFCDIFSNNITVPTAVRPVYECMRYNDLYICTGAQYSMNCNTSVHDFHYNRYHYHCMSGNCDCIGNKDTCSCYRSTLSSCFCTNHSSSITIPAAVSPVNDCVLYNDTYICTGAQYRMYCNTRMHYFNYQRYRNQNQYLSQCSGNNCYCTGNKDTCTCYSSTLSSCFCENYSNIITIPAAVRPVTDPDCVLYNDTYTCTGAQYRMYCNTRMHDFSFQRYQYQDRYQCVNNNCNCFGNKDTCTCSSSTLSSCFCETYGNIIALITAVTPVYDCVLYDTSYICTGAQYQMYCNTRMHEFNFQRYRNQNQYLFQCWNNNCNCFGNKDTCTCSSSTLSSCFCKTYGNIIALTSAVSPAYGCELYNDIYICTGVQYRMYCNTTVHDFYYQKYQSQSQNKYQYQCVNNNCYCIGNKDTCTCYSSTLSSCFCETYGNNIIIPTAVSPPRVSQCVLFNDTYICTGAQYRLFCDTRMHDFYYRRYRDQNQDEYQCVNNNCYCIGNKDTCTCSSSTFSSCFCETYGNSIALTTAVSPAYGCVLYNNTAYICTGAQYRMYCNTSVHDFHYDRYHYHCVNNNCYCFGNKDTCSCSSSTLSSCFCKTYGNTIALTTAVSPVYDCVLYNDTYICTGAQYHMYCNTSVHDFHYSRYHYHCLNNNCYCIGNKDTCSCYSSTSSSCFCTNHSSSITIPAAVSPVYDCVLYNDTYICTGAQYRMYCNTIMHYFYYWRYRNQNRYEYECWGNNCYCIGNKDTCTCYSSSISSCFCESNIFPTTLSPTTAGVNITLPDQYRNQTSRGYLQNLLEQIEYISAQELSLYTVTNILTVVFNASEKILDSSSSANPTELASYGNRLLKASEKLSSTLVKPTNTSDSVSFTLPAVEGQVFMVGPQFTLDKIPRLDTTHSSVDIDLIGIAKNNNGRAAVAFMSYNTMENLLKPDFFNTSKDTIKTMMSTVISATLPKTTNTTLTKPVNFTFRHIREFDPSGSLSCVYWNISEWIVDGCSVLKTNSSYTVCSCVHLSTFALVQISHPPEMDLVILLCVIMGLVFFSLALLTFVLYKWSHVRDWIRGCVVLGPEGYNREEWVRARRRKFHYP